MKKTIFISICVMVMLLMMSVSAQVIPEETVFVTNVTFWPSYSHDPGQMPLVCGEYFNFSAVIIDSCQGEIGTVGIQEVLFWIRAVDASLPQAYNTFSSTLDERYIPEVRISGNATHGVWANEYTPDPVVVPQGGKLEYILQGIKIKVAEDSATKCTVYTWGADYAIWEGTEYFKCGTTEMNCYSTDIYDAYDVWAIDGVGRALNSTCSCDVAIDQGSCTVWNIYDTNITIPSGCAGTWETEASECDYCDPLWTPVYTQCGGNDFDYAFMKGTMDKVYIGQDATCCDDTRNTIGNLIFNHDGGSSDCLAPYDSGQTVTCSIDAWLRGGHNYYGSNRNQIPAWGGDRKTVNFENMRKIGNFSFGSEFQPLVFDVDYDGRNDIFILDNGKIYDYSLEESSEVYLKRSVSTAYTWTGQPAIYGIEELI